MNVLIKPSPLYFTPWVHDYKFIYYLEHPFRLYGPFKSMDFLIRPSYKFLSFCLPKKRNWLTTASTGYTYTIKRGCFMRCEKTQNQCKYISMIKDRQRNFLHTLPKTSNSISSKDNCLSPNDTIIINSSVKENDTDKHNDSLRGKNKDAPPVSDDVNNVYAHGVAFRNNQQKLHNFKHPDPLEDFFSNKEKQCILNVFRIFSGKSSGLPFSLPKFFGRWWWTMIFNRLCSQFQYEDKHQKFLILHSEVEKGAIGALRCVFSKVMERDWKFLSSCVESKLLNEIQRAVEYLDTSLDKSEKQLFKLTLSLPSSLGSRLVGCRYFFGGLREAPTDHKIMLAPLTPVGISHFLVAKEALKDLAFKGQNVRTAFQSVSDLLCETMLRGGLIRVDVLCKVTQVVSIQSDTVLLSTSPTLLLQPEERFHYLRFEAPLEPSTNFKENDGVPHFNWIDGWKLVDINFAMNGNYPYNPDGFQDKRSLKIISSDCNSPF